MALWSARRNARVMGPATLIGQMALAYEDDSPEQGKRHAARVRADRLFWIGLVLTALGVVLQTVGSL